MFTHVLQEAGGYAPEEAEELTEVLLPDVLVINRSMPSGQPNGRRLDDDAIDDRVAMLFNGRIPSHGLQPHIDVSSRFPYLGAPHPAPVQSAAP